MKSIFAIIALSLSVLLSGCTTIGTSYDYDAGFDFSTLSTYNWLPMPVDFPIDSLARQRVKSAVDQQMKKKGLRPTTGSADFIISLQGQKNTIRQAPQSTVVSGQRAANEQYQEGGFTLTFIDAETSRLIWEGHAKGIASPYLSTEDRVKKINEAVTEMLNNFPPK